ncbi:hypothetical protein BKH46_04870 [Helicobacter sp. 12S02634-8]|uniref:SDR family oxidoreductase n=1 Tax=Helicobacter sp. 12S02634-8 TaxID=1476199 RepID=UPI000BA7A12D|nr:SDR family oxidoreductase [Helicobacter sp. 12S02634-8]PAF47056.1 hypothetical protein BKH46_04870 [Helicobacter sp. 12S02634-8]
MKPWALLTGGRSGIGRAIAQELSMTHHIVFISRDPLELNTQIQTLKDPKGHKVFKCDLKDLKETEYLMQEICKDYKIETFIHCAGINYVSYAKHFDYTQMMECANVNLYAAMVIIKYLLKKPAKDYLKQIIFISSISARKAKAGDGLYASTKGGLDAYMRALSQELAPQIRVNSILPGTIFDTQTTQKIFTQAQKAELLKQYPLGEGHCEDIAGGVRFLLQNKWITGQELIIDGGFCV